MVGSRIGCVALGVDARTGRGARIGTVPEFTAVPTSLIGFVVRFAANKCSIDMHIERHVGAVESDGHCVGHRECELPISEVLL